MDTFVPIYCDILWWVMHVRICKLTFVLAVALVAYQAECVMSCTVDACAFGGSSSSQNLPPCHRHHKDSQNPAPCSHQFISTTALSPLLTHDLGPTVSVGPSFASTSSFEFPLAVSGDAPLAQTTSPPGVPLLASSILRI